MTSVRINTTLGEFVVEMYTQHAPRTCRNFTELASQGYYNNTVFHRVIRDFMIQGGDPTGTVRRRSAIASAGASPTPAHPPIYALTNPFTHSRATQGRGGRSIYGDKFDDEPNDLKHVGAGVISMANAGPNTNGSQFFVTLAPCAHLDGKHTVFGRVSNGMEVIKRIGNIQTDRNDRPAQDVTILNCSVLSSS